MFFVLASTVIVAATNPRIARAQTRPSLPPVVTQKAPPVLRQMGSGSQSYLGLRVYQLTLWAPSDKWNPDEPHALDLESNRAISSKQLTDAAMDEMNRLAVGTSAQRQAWRRELEQVMPAVKKGDQVVAFCAPDHKTSFFYNGIKRGEIADPAFGAAFFSIWLDPRTKNPALRRSLLNH
jgi:Chalcone isomerase-like